MKEVFDFSENHSRITRTCGCCNYSHTEYYTNDVDYASNNNRDPKFLAGDCVFSFVDDSDYLHPTVKKIMYACPKCGCVQIETD